MLPDLFIYTVSEFCNIRLVKHVIHVLQIIKGELLKDFAEAPGGKPLVITDRPADSMSSPLPPVAFAQVSEAEVHVGVGVDVAVGVDLVGEEVDAAEEFFAGDDANEDAVFIGYVDVVVVDEGVEDVFEVVIALDEADIASHDFGYFVMGQLVPQVFGFCLDGAHDEGHVDGTNNLSFGVEDGDLAVAYRGQEHEGVEEVIVFPYGGTPVGWDHELVLAME